MFSFTQLETSYQTIFSSPKNLSLTIRNKQTNKQTNKQKNKNKKKAKRKSEIPHQECYISLLTSLAAVAKMYLNHFKTLRYEKNMANSFLIFVNFLNFSKFDNVNDVTYLTSKVVLAAPHQCTNPTNNISV